LLPPSAAAAGSQPREKVPAPSPPPQAAKATVGLVRGGRVIYTDFRGFIKDAKSKLSTIAELTAQALEESGLGLTMADIGFASYEGQE